LECQRGNISICCRIIDAASAESPRILVFLLLLKIVEHWAFKRAIKVCHSCFSAVSLDCDRATSIYLPLSDGRALKTDYRDFHSRMLEGSGWSQTSLDHKARIEGDAAIRQLEFESEKQRLEKGCKSRLGRVLNFAKSLRIRNPLWKTEFLATCQPYLELIVYTGPLTSYQLSLYASRIAICKSWF
jgi:hypothetical protein